VIDMVADIDSWNDRIIAEFRANAGRVAWSSAEDLAAGRPIPPLLPGFSESRGVPIILVRHIGARSGRERTNPLMYQPVDDGFAVFATFGGSPQHPAWHHNLTAKPEAVVEVGAETGVETIAVTARLTTGGEREQIWADQVALTPTFAEFEERAGRQVPVVVLQRAQDGIRIGELARRTGVSARSLRYYEKRGLLVSHRDHSGYRRYRDDVVPLVANLGRLFGAGLSVDDVRQFGSCVASADLGAAPCAPALDVYEQRLRVLDDRIATLTHLRDELAAQAELLRDRVRA
jgi:deazaflavin-dependent oxidoreductase (nitroreductase family)